MGDVIHMGIIKKIQRWLGDPRRSPKRRPVNQRSPVPLLTTQTVTSNYSRIHEQRATERPISKRDEIARSMKEMVNRSMELRNAKKVRSPQNLDVYKKRIATRLAAVPTKNPRANTRDHWKVKLRFTSFFSHPHHDVITLSNLSPWMKTCWVRYPCCVPWLTVDEDPEFCECRYCH